MSNSNSIVGKWDWYWKYDGNSSYSKGTLDFGSNGIWGSGSGSNQGKWFERNGMINWDFNNTPALIYLGVNQGGAMVGVMNYNDSSSRGVWYAIKQDSSTSSASEFDVSDKIEGTA